jgi:hypothetical protein
MEGIDKEQRVKNRFGGVNQDVADMQKLEHRKFGSGRFGEGASAYLAAARRTLQSSREVGLIGKNGQINERVLVETIKSAGLYGRQGAKAHEAMRSQLLDALEAERAGAIQTFKTLQTTAEVAAAAYRAATEAIAVGMFGEAGAQFWGLTKPSDSDRANIKDNINVHIAKVEVPAKDPDRWIIDLGRFAAKHVRAPRQARAALRR